jgi:outer membrane protein assembly factor BamE
MSKLRFLSVLVGLAMVSCSTILNNLPGVYTIDVQQGNIIDQEMVDQLRPNMTKRQVLFITGSPMLKDVFQQDRWDYIYSNQPGGEPRQQKKITLVFEGDSIIGIQGDFKPSSLPAIKASDETTVDVPMREVEKTLWEMIVALFGSDEANAVEETPEPEKDTEADPASEKESTPDTEQSDASSSMDAP